MSDDPEESAVEGTFEFGTDASGDDDDEAATRGADHHGDGGQRSGPSPDYSPEAAVRAQLDAIEASDADPAATADGDVPASVRTLFDFAAPTYRQSHRSLDGFATTLLGPMYDRLIGATALERGPRERSDDTYTVTVLARHPEGDRTYEFRLARQTAGKYEGCWMTVGIDMVYDGESPAFQRMPTVTVDGRTVTCAVGDQLRDVLLGVDGYSPHNDATQVANCGGNGLCGTCAVGVDGPVDEMGDRERRRLSLPPHDAESGLRLACRTHVEGDVTVRKHDGLWGQHVAQTVDDVADHGSDDHQHVQVTPAEYAGDYDYATASGGENR